MQAQRLIGSIIVLLTLALATAMSARAVPSAPRYRVICNPQNPLNAVDRRFLQEAFLRKVRAWPTGDVTRPVDLTPSSQARQQFSEDVLQRSVEAVRSYWQQRIFAGRDLPPPEVASDEAAIRFVMRDRGALGYVSASAALDGAKVLTIK